jgi:hypothetical protein
MREIDCSNDVQAGTHSNAFSVRIAADMDGRNTGNAGVVFMELVETISMLGFADPAQPTRLKFNAAYGETSLGLILLINRIVAGSMAGLILT